MDASTDGNERSSRNSRLNVFVASPNARTREETTNPAREAVYEKWKGVIMNRFFSPRGVRAALIAALGLTLVSAAPVSAPIALEYTAAVGTARVEVTPRDVAVSNQKVRMAHAALISMWGEGFRRVGQRFYAPGIIPFFHGVRTGCGIVRGSNAIYCPRDNTIYFDEVFIASQAKLAARQLGTDGDMAAVGVIAHEMGHAVAMQLGHVSRSTYANEATADCLAGAFTQQADRDGTLEEGDIDEAFYAMSTAGDPTPQLTGDRRIDGYILARAARMAHGTREQRMENFRSGLENGPRACLPEVRGL
jgi:predicted metalloprotease